MSFASKAPGVYARRVEGEVGALATGVPAFLGYAKEGAVDVPIPLATGADFVPNFGLPRPDGALALAVDGFFRNGGAQCYVVRLHEVDEKEPLAALDDGLASLAASDGIDLV